MKEKMALAGATTVALLFCYGFLWAIPQSAINPMRVPLAGSPADVGLAYENFTITPRDEPINLAGWWLPAEEARATLVFLHGGGSNRNSDFFKSLDFYRAAVDQGISVATIDLRNHGESDSDDTGLQFGRTEKFDALAAIDWARDKAPDQPLFLMGISMGGATAIHAAHDGADVDGMILLDPLLDTDDAFIRGGRATSPLPATVFIPSALAAETFFGLPSGADEALQKAARLELPILLIQDPDDPVTRAVYARELAERNQQVTLWEAPAVADDHPGIAWKEDWGSHVAAFALYPEQTMAQIDRFLLQQGVSAL